MVLLLQARPGMTAAELARELEVSERTVTRDAQALSEAGIPVYAERGRAGGYRLVGGYRTGLTGLARDEAEALFLSGLPSALREMGLADAASAARLKVSAALTPALRDAPAGAGRRFHLDAPGWYQEPVTPELLPAVADAVWRDRLLLARYRRAGRDTDVERELAPYGLVLKAGVWYLCARVGDDVRVYRIDRFTAVTVSTTPFVRDEGFDLPAFWEERSAAFARSLLRTEVTLRLSETAVRRLPHTVDRAAAREALAAAGPPGGRLGHRHPGGRVPGCRLRPAAGPRTGVGGPGTARPAGEVHDRRGPPARPLRGGPLRASFRCLGVRRPPPGQMLDP